MGKYVLPAVAAYGIISIITFGHAMGHVPKAANGTEDLLAMVATILWPFYWSWYFQQ